VDRGQLAENRLLHFAHANKPLIAEEFLQLYFVMQSSFVYFVLPVLLWLARPLQIVASSET
jgi:hypothetical protein